MSAILIVDPDPHARDDALKLLSGFPTRTAENVAAARAQLRPERPGLVLLEVLLPDQDGLAFCHELKVEWPDMGVVLTSCLLAEERALQAGADGYLLKPWSREALHHWAARFLPDLSSAVSPEGSES